MNTVLLQAGKTAAQQMGHAGSSSSSKMFGVERTIAACSSAVLTRQTGALLSRAPSAWAREIVGSIMALGRTLTRNTHRASAIARVLPSTLPVHPVCGIIEDTSTGVAGYLLKGVRTPTGNWQGSSPRITIPKPAAAAYKPLNPLASRTKQGPVRKDPSPRGGRGLRSNPSLRTGVLRVINS